jgi:cysteine desulfurase
MFNMSNIASSSLKQASRLCAKQASSAGLIRVAPLSRVVPASAQRVSRRGYVSETKKDNAQVNVETIIRADKKAFFAETSKLPENQSMQGTTANANTMMSPIAGVSEFIYYMLWRC